MGILITFGSLVIAAAAAMFELILQSAVNMKSECNENQLGNRHPDGSDALGTCPW